MRGMRRAYRSSMGLPSRSTPGGSSVWSGETGRASQPCSSAGGIKKEELGHVRFQGSVVPPKRRPEHVFLVMQDPDYQLFRPSVRDELASAAPSPSDVDELRLEAVLRGLALGDVADRHPASLSGGQKQRCVCAIASESGAQALLLDEPTSGLDFRNMERLALILREEASRGKTVAVVSHDTEFLSKACDQIVLIE